jgi:hypothetical protein
MRAASIALAILGVLFALWAGRFWIGASNIPMPDVTKAATEEYRVNALLALSQMASMNRVATLLTAIAGVLSTAAVLVALWSN